MKPEVECVARVENTLGEGPWWDAAGQALWWVDAWQSRLWRTAAGAAQPVSLQLPAPLAGEPIGSMVLDVEGRVVCAMRRDFWRVDPATGEAALLAEGERGRPPTNRLNDGKCDRVGRYWCGSLNTDWQQASGALYRLDPGGQVACVIASHGISNGIAFSPDDRVFYFADTSAGVVLRFDFDLASGTLANRRVFIDMRDAPGQLDGATVDAEGNYWSALFGAAAVACFDPAGRLVRRIDVPTRHPTMCTFGGPTLETLYVTTARRFLEPAELAAQPLAGSLFAIHGLGARGLPEPRFGARSAGI